MRIIFIFFILYCLSYSNPIDIVEKLRVYQFPNALSSKIDWRDDTQIHVSSLGFWISSQSNIYRIDKPSKALMSPLHVESFSISQSGHPVAIIDDNLGLINYGFFIPSVKLPMKGYVLSGGPNDTLYLYNTKKVAPIYHFDGEKVKPMAYPNQVVLALTYIGNIIVFATKDGIFSLKQGGTLGLLMPLQDFDKVLSLSVNYNSAEVFLSTNDTVYSLSKNIMTPLVVGIGGVISFYDDRLWIVDSLRKQIYILMPK